jgi:hypothetical protein
MAWAAFLLGCRGLPGRGDGSPEPRPEARPPGGAAAGAGPHAPAAALGELLQRLGVRHLPRERRLEVAGRVNQARGVVEVFGCAPGGKTHESVVVLDCVPSGLHAGLVALGLKPGAPGKIEAGGKYQPPSGDLVKVLVSWKGADGRDRSAWAEDWVWNRVEKRSMRREGWVFAGSVQAPMPGRPEERIYAADHVKSIVTTYHDATSVLETPLPEAADDTVFHANQEAVPPVGTAITVLFSPLEAGGVSP